MKKSSLKDLTKKILLQEEKIKEGGDSERQKRLGRLTVRERLERLLDTSNSFVELGVWAAYEMYQEWGDFPAAGVVTGIGEVSGRKCMIIANDATVKAGAMFPQSVKKVLRAQRIAFECHLPTIYLVDSSGVFLPLQSEIFPDEDDFGRIFRNNAIFSSAGIPQYAAIMGNCIAGGGYLPVLCDKLLMTEGSGLYLAGPALVKAAIGQEVDTEELGGVKMHSEISGTVDFHVPNDEACLDKLRKLIGMLPENVYNFSQDFQPTRDPNSIYEMVGDNNALDYDALQLVECLADEGSIEVFKSEYGKAMVNCYARIYGIPVGIIANQRKQTKTGKGEIEIGGVIYSESADKTARFIMDCNQMKIPLIFLQDTVGFMVGKKAEESGIIRSGAKLVNVVSNSIVPKITVVVGNSFGAGNYALCGKAYDPNFIFAWPNAKYAVMGADQASGVLHHLYEKKMRKDSDEIRDQVKEDYLHQMDICYGAARGWVDAIIPPHSTRDLLKNLLGILKNAPMPHKTFQTGVIQV